MSIVLDWTSAEVSRGVSGVIGKTSKQFPLTPLTPRELFRLSLVQGESLQSGISFEAILIVRRHRVASEIPSAMPRPPRRGR